MEECVEADWVSVRPNVFEEKERHKLVFMVAWSLVEGRFALTCHDRTEQRRRWSLHCQDPGSGGPHPLGSGTTTTPRISPARRTEEVGSVCTPKGRHTVKNSGGKIGGPAGLNSTSESNDIILGSWDIVTAQAVEDIQALEPMEDIPGVPSFCADDGDERDDLEADPGGGGAGENFSWAGLFSFQDLRAAHLQLCAVNSDLEHCLPPFPEERSGGGGALWSVLFGTAGDHHASSQRETDALCYQVQVYLGHALDTCGWKILSQVLFAESSERHAEEYYESLNELRHKGYEDALERSKRRLQELLEKHRALDSMVDLLQLYTEEDQAFGDLLEATTQLYHYLLQPFRDMRELAMLRKQQIKISLETERLGPRRVDGLRKEDEEWTRKAHAAVLSIQDLTVKFFETTTRAQKAMYERMRADQKKLGRSSWVSAVERMERLQYATSKETLQLMRAKEICLEQRKHSLKEQMQSLQGGDDAMMRLDHMEALYYKLQLQLYDIQAEVLLCEELLLNAQLHSLRRHMNEYQDEVVYYDAYESPDAMEGAEDCVVAQTPPTDEELHVLQHRIRQLEARRGRITAKKTYLKNKKEICIVNHNQKLQQRQGSHCEDIDPLLAPQQRGDPDEDEEKGNARVSQERQRTLDRLRSFKQRYPGHVTLKSSRLRLGQSHTKRRAGGAGAGRASEQSGTPGGRPSQQPGTQSASVQTDSASSLPPLSRPPSDAHGYESASLPPPELTARAEEGLGSRLPPFASMPLLSDLPPSATPPSHLSSGPPPPPPPPPPLLPYVGEDQQGEEGERDSRRSPVQRPAAGCESPSALQVAMAFSPQFFDSSQLLTARKKLRKTASMETSQWRRACSPMDEVLASLKRGSFHLRKAELRVLAPDPDDDESNNILAQIRQGVRLRKVRTRPDAAGGGRRAPGGLPRSADALTRSIHEALRRIKEASPDSDSDEDDEDSLPGTDWDN